MDVEKKGGRNYLTWTDEMDEAMLNVFVEHYNRGDRAQNGWKPHVYTAVVKNVRAKCNVDITKENVISRCKTIDRHYVNVSKMLSTSGFGWDWIHNKLMVDSEDVWRNYVKANKDAACYRHKVIKFWDSISLVFSKDHATGTGARTAGESAAEMAAENVNNINTDSAATSSTQTGEEKISIG
uniref:Myb/SANT-like domain-containing protein n=1 Tax=Triticum urartu TaxID=4572 RepID=A0A8R7JW30_TRIUA